MMSAHHQIKKLQNESLLKAVESISVFIFVLITSSFLPNLLIRYVYADQNLMEQPKILEYIPIAAFAIGAGYFLFAMIGNFMRAAKIKKLESDMMAMSDDCCNGCTDCQCDDHGNCSCGSCDVNSMGSSTSEMARAMTKRKVSKRK